MKKLISLLLILSAVVSMLGCDASVGKQNQADDYRNSPGSASFLTRQPFKGKSFVGLGEGSYQDTQTGCMENKSNVSRISLPISLTSLEPIQQKRFIKVSGAKKDDARDVNENSYNPDKVIYPAGGTLYGEYSENEEDSFVVYYLNSNYRTFSAVLYRPYSTLSATTGWDEWTTVKIYADDNLIYEAPNFSQNDYYPISFNLNVSGVRYLKIVMRGVLMWSTGDFGLYRYTPRVCMADAVLQKQ